MSRRLPSKPRWSAAMAILIGAPALSRQHLLFQAILDERAELAGEFLVEPDVAADGVLDVALGVEGGDLGGGRGDEGGDGAGVALAHGVDDVGLVDQLDR